MPLSSFNDAIRFSGAEPKTILMGNGFSMAYDADSFRYYVFLTMLREDPDCENLAQIFDLLNTDDFEKVMNALNSAVEIVNEYGCACNELETIRLDEIQLKEKLIGFISETHPENCTLISDPQYLLTRSFLHNFNAFYTTNYDILLYWALIHHQCGGPAIGCDDGFRGTVPNELTWREADDQNVFYLHGAMHIYKNGQDIIKLRYNGDQSLREQVQRRIDNGQYPLFVAGRNSAEKAQKIDENKYLRHCLQQFADISGALFVHGHSFDDKDDHLFQLIQKNTNITKLCVSLHGDEDSAANIQIKAKASALIARRSLLFYDADSANLWAE